MTTMITAERCRAQARSMDEEGWYVCANVLRQAAEELERLSDEVATLRHYGNKDCTAQADEYIEWCKTNNRRPMQETK